MMVPVIQTANLISTMVNTDCIDDFHKAFKLIQSECATLKPHHQHLLIGYTIHYVSSQLGQGHFLRKLEDNLCLNKEYFKFNIIKMAAKLACFEHSLKIKKSVDFFAEYCKTIPLSHQLLLVGYTVHYFSTQESQGRFLGYLEQLN